MTWKRKLLGTTDLVCMFFYNKIVSVVKLLALVDNSKRFLSFGILRTRAMIKAFFSASKVFCCSIPQV